jgi:hypothetical protein
MVEIEDVRKGMKGLGAAGNLGMVEKEAGCQGLNTRAMWVGACKWA